MANDKPTTGTGAPAPKEGATTPRGPRTQTQAAAGPAATPTQTAATSEKNEDTVEISRETLDTILSKIEELTEKSEKDSRIIEKLEAIADKGRLAHYDSKETSRDGVLITRAKIGFFEGSPIVAWQKVRDEVGFRDGRLVTNQTIRVFLQETEGEAPVAKETEYLFWAQNTTCQEGEVMSKNITKEGEYWTVELPDGRQVTLDIRFINPF